MIEDSISLDLLARLYSTQLTTNGEKHLLDHNRIYYKLLRKIIAKGQDDGQLSCRSNVNEMVKLYALCERAFFMTGVSAPGILPDRIQRKSPSGISKQFSSIKVTTYRKYYFILDICTYFIFHSRTVIFAI